MSDYLRVRKPGYAVFLKGPWKCAKPYFIKNWIETLKTKKNDSEQFFTPGSYLCFALWVLKRLSSGKPLQSGEYRTSTIYSALKRLQKDSYVIYSDRYEMEDPFFRDWILASDEAPFA